MRNDSKIHMLRTHCESKAGIQIDEDLQMYCNNMSETQIEERVQKENMRTETSAILKINGNVESGIV